MKKAENNSIGNVLDAWLSKHDVINKDAHVQNDDREDRSLPSGKDLRKMRNQDVLDLHGKTKTEAEAELAAFLRDSHSKGLKKVLIIHGKGYHSKGGPIIKKTVYDFLQTCPFTGQTGIPDPRDGGSGAVWVALRQRSR